MGFVRKYGEDHIKKSLKQIDANSWLIGHLILHRSPFPSETATWNDDSDNSSYTLTQASMPLPATTTPADSPYIELIYGPNDSAVWFIGKKAICKVRYTEEGVTPESATLNFVKNKQPSFETPTVLHHAFGEDRNFLFISRVPGRTLDNAWSGLDEHWRRHYVDAVTKACMEMAQWKGSQLGGVDGQYIPEDYLTGPKDGPKDGLGVLHASCEAIGMDCSNIVFYHADLGPTNIIVVDEPETGKVGIIDFEISGFFPELWVRTKFRLSSGMDFSASASDNPTSWRVAVQHALGAYGYEDCAQGWMKWWGYEAPHQ